MKSRPDRIDEALTEFLTPSTRHNGSGPAYVGAPEPRAGGSGVDHYLALLRRGWRLILIALVITIGGTAAFWYQSDRTYRAEALLQVAPISQADTRFAGTGVIRDSGGPTRDVETLARIVRSNPVADRAAEILGDGRSPDTLLAQVSATPVGQSFLVSVRASSSDADGAARLANAFARATIAVRSEQFESRIEVLLSPFDIGVPSASPTDDERVAQLRALKGTPDPSLQLDSLARAPGAPSSPGLAVVLLAAALIGLIVGVAAAVLSGRKDPKFREEAQLRERLAVPVLARIPAVRARTSGAPNRFEREQQQVQDDVFRALTRDLTLVERDQLGTRVFLFSGAGPGDGTTACAFGAAHSLAETGHRVILVVIDETTRSADVVDHLGMERAHLLSSVLSGRMGLAQALRSTGGVGERLKFLVSGSDDLGGIDGVPATIAPATVRGLLAEASSLGIDYVIFDSWPLESGSNALAVATAADDVMLVARTDETDVTRLSVAEQLLQRLGIVPRGIVVMPSQPRQGLWDRRHSARPEVVRPR